MSNFIALIKDVLDERDKTAQDLFNDNVISENTFYKFKRRSPNLNTIIKIANYLEISIDYMFNLNSQNNFNKYHENNIDFYNNLMSLLNSCNISQSKFCADLHYSRSNLWRWKRGVNPSIETLLEIANYLNCSVDDLLQAD